MCNTAVFLVKVDKKFPLLSQVRGLIEQKHQHLLAVVQRHFAARRFCLHLLKEMRLSRLKTLSQTDFRSALMEDPAKSHSCLGSTLKVRLCYPFIDASCQTHQRKNKSLRAPLQHFPSVEAHCSLHICAPQHSSSGSLAERHVGPESQLVGHNFQQEFLSELETGAELLQTHVQLVLGNALSHAIQGAMEAPPTEALTTSRQGEEVKVRSELHYSHGSDDCVSHNAGVSNSSTQYRQSFKRRKSQQSFLAKIFLKI